VPGDLSCPASARLPARPACGRAARVHRTDGAGERLEHDGPPPLASRRASAGAMTRARARPRPAGRRHLSADVCSNTSRTARQHGTQGHLWQPAHTAGPTRAYSGSGQTRSKSGCSRRPTKRRSNGRVGARRARRRPRSWTAMSSTPRLGPPRKHRCLPWSRREHLVGARGQPKADRGPPRTAVGEHVHDH
jgi:hypothetical protein